MEDEDAQNQYIAEQQQQQDQPEEDPNLDFNIQIQGDSQTNNNNFNNDFANNNNNQNQQDQYVYNNDGNNVLGDLNDSNQKQNPGFNPNQNNFEKQSTNISDINSQPPQAVENPDKGGFKLGACIATVGFKLGAMLSYLIFSLVDSELTAFIFIVLFAAFDFWTVKNITGRLLVGLKWYSQAQEDGSEVWTFESQAGNYKPNPKNSKIFWGSQLINQIFWAIMFIVKLLSISFTWAIFLLFPNALNAINSYGYYKCRGEHQQKAKDFKLYVAEKGIKRAIK